MSNATTLQTNNNKLSANNTDLASILNTINNLPEAGSGGSGGLQKENVSVTLSITSETSDRRPDVSYLTYENGTYVSKFVNVSTNSYSATLTVAKGSEIHIQNPTYNITNFFVKTGDIITTQTLARAGIAHINGSGTIIAEFSSNGIGGGTLD